MGIWITRSITKLVLICNKLINSFFNIKIELFEKFKILVNTIITMDPINLVLFGIIGYILYIFASSGNTPAKPQIKQNFTGFQCYASNTIFHFWQM